MDVTSAPRSDASGSVRLWFAFLGGMTAYALHLVIGFWTIPAACGTTVQPLIPWLEAALTLVLAGAAAAATVVAVRLRRGPTRSGRGSAPTPDGAGASPAWDVAPGSSTAQFMATTGIVLNALALLVILLEALPLLLVSPCA